MLIFNLLEIMLWSFAIFGAYSLIVKCIFFSKTQASKTRDRFKLVLLIDEQAEHVEGLLRGFISSIVNSNNEELLSDTIIVDLSDNEETYMILNKLATLRYNMTLIKGDEIINIRELINLNKIENELLKIYKELSPDLL